MIKLPEEGIVKLLIHCLAEAPHTHVKILMANANQNPSALGKTPNPGLYPNSMPGPSKQDMKIHVYMEK